MVRIWNKYVYEVDFDYANIVNNYKNSIIDFYGQSRDTHQTFDIPLVGERFNNFYGEIVPKLNKIIENIFFVGEKYMYQGINIYLQHPNAPFKEQSFFHHHMSAPGNLTAVFYFNIPKEGGEIEFEELPRVEGLKIKPRINTLYLFPQWLRHKGCPHKDNIKRFVLIITTLGI